MTKSTKYKVGMNIENESVEPLTFMFLWIHYMCSVLFIDSTCRLGDKISMTSLNVVYGDRRIQKRFVCQFVDSTRQ